MPIVKAILLVGGIVLLTDALTSLQYIRDKRWFCQAVRIERFIFAVTVIILGVLL